MLARATTGEPVLWTQRRRDLLLVPPTFALRFDILQRDAPMRETRARFRKCINPATG